MLLIPGRNYDISVSSWREKAIPAVSTIMPYESQQVSLRWEMVDAVFMF